MCAYVLLAIVQKSTVLLYYCMFSLFHPTGPLTLQLIEHNFFATVWKNSYFPPNDFRLPILLHAFSKNICLNWLVLKARIIFDILHI